jgi:uncharacterized protein (TIGR02271 family)
MPSRRIIAVFDSQSAAQRAREELIELGLPTEDVSIIDQSSQELSAEGGSGERGGFWAHIKAMFMPDEDRATLDECIRRGGYVLSATVSDPYADEAIRRLDDAGAVDLEQRSAQWGTTAGEDSGEPIAAQAREESRATPESETIPVIEERLRVGKREVNRGSVRVRSYIVEEPVHEQVSLHEERVEVERRPVNKPTRPVAQGSPDDLLQERTIDVTETAEQAVVAKEAVVTEEVRVRKSSQERVEDINETVRHTEVEVEDGRKTGVPPRAPRGAPKPARH